MRAGAVGINLTQANHVFIMDPCLNVALEDQVSVGEGVGEGVCVSAGDGEGECRRGRGGV